MLSSQTFLLCTFTLWPDGIGNHTFVSYPLLSNLIRFNFRLDATVCFFCKKKDSVMCMRFLKKAKVVRPAEFYLNNVLKDTFAPDLVVF